MFRKAENFQILPFLCVGWNFNAMTATADAQGYMAAAATAALW